MGLILQAVCLPFITYYSIQQCISALFLSLSASKIDKIQTFILLCLLSVQLLLRHGSRCLGFESVFRIGFCVCSSPIWEKHSLDVLLVSRAITQFGMVYNKDRQHNYIYIYIYIDTNKTNHWFVFSVSHFNFNHYMFRLEWVIFRYST
jgi:hypothetical protein